MKITLPPMKRRAKWLNDLLRSKRSAPHKDPLNPSRAKRKQENRRMMRDFND